MRLSVIILTKNEEKNIQRAINSVKPIADEILVLDSGSTDKTTEIAKSLGAKVFFRDFDDFSSQRNYAIDLSSEDWVFFLDADEEVSKELRESIKKAITKDNFSCYEVSRRTYYLGKFLDYVWYPEYVVRLFKKSNGKYEGQLHEKLVCNGKVGRLEGDLYHYSYKNLHHQFIKTVDYAQKMAEILYKKGKKPKLHNFLINPILIFLKLFILKKGFLEGKRGIIIAVSGFVYVFLKYAFLYELYLKEKYKDKLW